MEIKLLPGLLEGLRVLVLEDEFLIAMDVEQLCRDHGAEDVAIARSIEEAEDETTTSFDVAIIDVYLNNISTFPFAARLQAKETPFVFASGYTDLEEMQRQFPGVTVVGKPYAGDELIRSVAAACGRQALML